MDEEAAALYEAIARSLAPYVEELVIGRLREAFGDVTDAQRDAARHAGLVAAREVDARLAALLATDIDEQRSTPLAELRRVVPYATEVLERFEVPPRTRDRYLEQRFPDDRYGLTPASMSVLGADVEELAIVWGAAKAMAHRRRHG